MNERPLSSTTWERPKHDFIVTIIWFVVLIAVISFAIAAYLVSAHREEQRVDTPTTVIHA